MDRIVLQPEFDEILKEKSTEPVWVQYKHCEEPAENGNLEFFQKDSKFHIDLEPSKKPTRFSINSISHDNKSVEIAYENEVSGKKAVRKFVAPMQKFALHWDPNNQARQRPASWIDVSDGGLGVSCSLDGSILVWLADTGKIRRILDGHIGDVNFCKFFPSGLVVLSGAADMRLKVWSVEDGSSPVTLTGHCYGVSDAAIVERGRNVISVGRDGACKLYDVGEAKCLATVAKYECIINACAITSLDDGQMAALSVPPREEPPSDREILTENKLIACACEDGFLRVVSVRARKQMFEFDCGRSGVNCCCFLSPTKLACGTQNGHIFVFDLKNGTSNSWREFRSSILSMKPFGDGFIATTGDGSCFTCCPNEPGRTIDLTGPNCDPVYTVAFNQTHVFTCCRDGYIRKYSLEHLIR